MDDVTRHPDDETLHDLVAGTLDDARSATVRAHLARCAACAAFVQSAASTAQLLAAEAVETMPAAAAERLHASVATAWRERVAGIAASEAAADADATVPVPVPSAGEFAGYAPITPDEQPGAAKAATTKAPTRRGRRLVPVLAFVVLGALAGTSYLVGQQQEPGTANDASTATTSGDAGATASEERDAAMSPEAVAPPEAGAPVAGDVATGTAVEPGSVESDKAAADAAAGGVVDSAAPTAPLPPPSDYDDFVEQDRLCIATRDEAQLMLPDGRIPQQIVRGPLGTYLVCG